MSCEVFNNSDFGMIEGCEQTFSINLYNIFGEEYTNGEDVYKVDYDQFHALHIYMIQKQQAKIKGLELEVDSLKQKLDRVMKYLEIED